MLQEEDIVYLNKLRRNKPDAYKRKLRILGIADADVPYREVKVTPNKASATEDGKHIYHMGGKPYYGIPPAGYMPSPTKIKEPTQITKKQNSTAKKKKDAHKTDKRQGIKKKNTVVLIDAEGIGADKCPAIVGQAKSIGEIADMRYFARQKDDSTRKWKDMAAKYNIKPILSYGEPEHNKIDNLLIKHAKKMLKDDKNLDIFCIAARDGDFTELTELLRQQKKRVVILAPRYTSQKLKSASNEVRGI